jgi:hypothetical protein
MRRREFITLIGSAAALWSRIANAQKPGAVRRIGVLTPFTEDDQEGKAWLIAFQEGCNNWDGRRAAMFQSTIVGLKTAWKSTRPS